MPSPVDLVVLVFPFADMLVDRHALGARGASWRVG
jgi:hypothetical protein